MSTLSLTEAAQDLQQTDGTSVVKSISKPDEGLFNLYARILWMHFPKIALKLF